MKALLALLLTTTLCSCASTAPKKEPQKASPNLENEYRAAEASARAGDSKKALARLKKIVQQAPDSDIADDAHLLMGNVRFNLQQYNEALTNYEAITNGAIASPLEVEARLRSVRALLRLSRVDDAAEILERSSNWRSLTPEQEIEFDKLRYDAFSAQKRNDEALLVLVGLAEKAPQNSEREKYRSLAYEVLESRLGEDDLYKVASSDRYRFLQAPAKFRYALLMAERRDYAKARGYLSEVMDLVPGTELADRSSSLVQQIDARNRVDPRTIGVVLPLSGKQAAIGYKALRGIQLGLGIYGKNGSGFRLAVIDSEGNPDAARRAVERLVQEDNVIAIIGGLLSKTANAEAAKAQEFGVPAIMLSQKAGVTQAGDAVFRNALTSQMQVQALVELAMGQLGLKNFAIIYPNDAYGTEYANLFWDEVKARGGDITGAQPYDPKETDFRGHVQRLVSTFYLEDRAEEYRVQSRKYAEKNPNRSARQGGPSIEDILPPIVDFDAVFIPDSARAVGQIAPMLAYNNVNKVRLLGTNLWNSPALAQRGQKFVENSIFIDSVLATDPSFRSSDFYSNFKSTFEEEPGLTEVQAYDSALILRQLIGGGERTRIGLQQRMSSLHRFTGAIGPLSVNSEREIRRPMTALTVRDGKVVPLESVQK